jgi:hypothetical protein
LVQKQMPDHAFLALVQIQIPANDCMWLMLQKII